MGGREAGPEPKGVGTQDNFSCAALPAGKNLLLFVPSSSSSSAPTGHYHRCQDTLPAPTQGHLLQQNPTSQCLVAVCMWVLQP